jgi:plasmid maintenance system antidote protein VapI
MTHPGDLLEYFLKPKKMDNGDLCAAIGVKPDDPMYEQIANIYRCVPGAKITPEISEKFGRFFKTDVQYWLFVQKRYDEEQK